MKEYLFHWEFWAAVVAVALAVNWVYDRFLGGSGKLV